MIKIMFKNIWSVLIIGLILVSGIGFVSASSIYGQSNGNLNLNTYQYPSHFDNMAYQNIGNNNVLFNGILKFTNPNSTIGIIAGGVVRLVITVKPCFPFSHTRVVYNEASVTDNNGAFNFNINHVAIIPGQYSATLSYDGDNVYGPCENSTKFNI